MADSADASFYNFYRPHLRGQLPIETLNIPRSLKKIVRRGEYKVTIDTAFEAVIAECAKEGTDHIGSGERHTTWINPIIQNVFIELHVMGKAHSVECWQDDKLVGGLYGLSIGKVFCGESMFSRAPNASKVALVHLCARLWKAGYTVLDTQFINEHLKQFGAYEIPQKTYERLIEKEMRRRADFSLDQKFPKITEKELVFEYLDYSSSIS